MATLKGFQANEVKPQPGFEPAQNENGGWEGTHTFTLTRQSFDNTAVRSRFRKGVSVVTLDPNVPSFFSFMTLDRAKVKFGEGDLIWITADFAGADSAQYGGGDSGGLSTSALPTYELDCSLAESPLSKHPKWAGLTDQQKTALGHLLSGVLVFDIEREKICQINEAAGNAEDFFDPFLPYDTIVTGDCLEFAKIIAGDQSTYLAPITTWTERTEGDTQLTSAQINKIGNIATPRGSPPTPNGGRDWMITNIYQVQVGSKFTTNIVWTLSEKGGHSEFLYSE